MMRKNKFLMNNKETGDNAGERREDKRLSLTPQGYYNNICYQVVITSNSNNSNITSYYHLTSPPTLQLLPTLAANIGSFSAGLAVGYPGLVQRQLEHQVTLAGSGSLMTQSSVQSQHYPPSHNNNITANITANISLNIPQLLDGLEMEVEDETFIITDDHTNLIGGSALT